MSRDSAAPYLHARRPPVREVTPAAGGYYLALRRRAERTGPAPILRLVAEPTRGDPVPRGARPPRPDTLRARFEALVDRWKDETRFESSSTKLFLHPAYQQIIGMGPDVVPLLLERLTQGPDHWSWALRAITGADPVPPEARGNLRQMAAAWLDWARRAGLA